MQSPRPTGLIVLAFLAILIGIAQTGSGIVLLLGAFQGVSIWPFGFVFLSVGLFALTVGNGLINRRAWSRLADILLSLLVAVLSFLTIGSTDGSVRVSFGINGAVIGVPTALVMLYLLTRYDIQAYLSPPTPPRLTD